MLRSNNSLCADVCMETGQVLKIEKVEGHNHRSNIVSNLLGAGWCNCPAPFNISSAPLQRIYELCKLLEGYINPTAENPDDTVNIIW